MAGSRCRNAISSVVFVAFFLLPCHSGPRGDDFFRLLVSSRRYYVLKSGFENVLKIGAMAAHTVPGITTCSRILCAERAYFGVCTSMSLVIGTRRARTYRYTIEFENFLVKSL